ncbi:DASH family cryptochrome [Psychromonas sp. KJ10-10]|uniref:DASH family cryptochrome n=1 Tax=Psychromonas sp. KJ10-10 TaxID=3391823 RepID=UPI0039B62B44
MKRCLYFVTKDLRINDNLALQFASKSEQLLCVYVIDKKWFQSNKYQSKALGDNRWQFLQNSLKDFNQSLMALGQQLHVVYGEPLSVLVDLCLEYQITDVIKTRLPGTFENRLSVNLENQLPTIKLHQVEQFTLFTEKLLPFSLNELPISYSKFKKSIAGVIVPEPITEITCLPTMFNPLSGQTINRPEWLTKNTIKEVKQGHYFAGGEQQALKHLNSYFSSDAPLTYKQVRNELDGFLNSTKLSPWLGYGCISPRQVFQVLSKFELQYEKNSSTEWIYAELLWREYFQWLHFNIQEKIYQFKGLATSSPLTTFYPERFKKWCLGRTPYPLVNACMNELRISGYLSNRGRQIVASCLVNELSVDWRYGATWFEEHLIDYDARC